MYSNSSFLLLILCYILQFSAVVMNATIQRRYDYDYMNMRELMQYGETTPRYPYVMWTPGREVKRMKFGGKEIIFRVVNGQQVNLGEIPYQVSLRKQVRKTAWFANFCGATILTPTALLSATHCFRERSMLDSCCGNTGRAEKRMYMNVWAVAGILEFMTHFHGDKDTEHYGQWRKIRTVNYHTSYSFPSHDIAIIFLARPFIVSDNVKPIPYATTFENYKGTCLVSGYGRIATKHRSTHLLKADLRMLDTKICDRIHQRNMRQLICTSDEISDSGKGDSGGPLVCKNTNDPMETNHSYGILVGIVSGKRMAKYLKDSTFFTRVSAYKEFIEKTIKKNKASHSKLSLLCVVLLILIQWIL